MSVVEKMVVVLGATGIVGSGAVLAFLEAGAFVCAVGRSQKKLRELKEQVPEAQASLIIFVEGNFNSLENAKQSFNAVIQALGGKQIDHVVSAVGIATLAPGWPSEAQLVHLYECMHEHFDPTYYAAQAFLPALKEREGSTYILTSGSSSHMVFGVKWWLASFRNSAINTLMLTLACETAKAKVRVNCFCIHFGVAESEGGKNLFGVVSTDKRKVGKGFVRIVQNPSLRGRLVCPATAEDIQTI